MKYLPSGTLRSFLAIPQVKPQKLESVMTPVAAKNVKAVWDQVSTGMTKLGNPDLDAVEFYCLNHLVAEIRKAYGPDEILPAWAQKVVSRYVEVLSAQGLRMFSYILLIITREARHMHTTSFSTPFYGQLPDAVRSFHTQICGVDEMSAVSRLCSKPPKVELEKYVGSMVTIFTKGAFGAQYGGKPWANIAKCLHRVLTGETSIEQMVDSAYSLAHNGGPMFNKGMIYSNYSSEFIKVLDVQRSGQIPEAVRNAEFSHLVIPVSLKGLVDDVCAHLPGVFGTAVDWGEVEKHGVKSYQSEKAVAPKPPPKPVFFGGKPAILVGQFKVLPKQVVSVYKRI